MYISDNIITSKHYLVHFVCAFASGIYFSVNFGIIFSLTLSLVLGALALFTLGILKITGVFKTKYLFLSIILILATVLGIFRIYYAEFMQSNTLRKYEGNEVWLCGTITSDPHITSSGYYYSFELDVFGVSDKRGNFGTVTMYIPQPFGCDFNFGDNVYAWTKLESPKADESPLYSDYYMHLRGKNIFLTGTTRNINPLPGNILPTPVVALKNSGAWLRSKISYSVNQIFHNDNISIAILNGILIGDKSGFDDLLYQQFSYSGISHIVAVSGLHISILFSFLMIISKSVRLNKKLNVFIAVPFILLFMSASAFTPSVCRASVMLLIMICSALFRERYNPITSLFFALGLILSVTPYALFSKSLVLSFSATFGIFAYFSYINSLFVKLTNLPRFCLTRYKLIRKGLLYLSSSISLSLSSFLGTAYFLILFFGNISKVQFVTNLWVIPIVTVVFCLGYLCCILYYICPWFVIKFLKYPLDWSLWIIKFTVDKLGTPQNVLAIPAENLNPVYAILYFGIALIIYMSLKALYDIKTEKQTNNKKAS